MTARLKVYARIHEVLGHVIFRINREIVKRAPKAIEFVDSVGEADCQIVHCIGSGSLTYVRNKNFILFQHNFLSSDIPSKKIWLGIFQQAVLVVSYADIPAALGSDSFNFLLTPWGVDTDVFKNKLQCRSRRIVTTGWSCDGEAIKEVYKAGKRCNMLTVNVGDDFKLGADFSAVCRLTDTELCDLYNTSEYVSGLRFVEGFELPVIEGTACGCRPLCFDLAVYRKWFGNIPIFVPHCKGESLIEALYRLLKLQVNPITADELFYVRTTFDWQNIANRFWSRLLELI